MSELTEFLLARIAEDEAVAREATAGRWQGGAWVDPAGRSWSVVAEPRPLIAKGIEREADAAHIAHWDPARVLAECEAKRRIVELHEPYRRIYGVGCSVCLLPSHLPPDADGYPCTTLRLLALPYADHPDYDERWRP